MSEKMEFKYCFTAEKTGLDTLININGYYAPSPDNEIRQWKGRILPNDTLKPAFVFYDNGFVFETTCIDHLIENKKFSFFWVADPGGYILHGDTIKLQTLDTPGGQSRELGEYWFKIIDRNTLKRIDKRDPSVDPYVVRIYNFRPLEIKIKPEDTWIYNKKWFRCNEK